MRPMGMSYPSDELAPILDLLRRAGVLELPARLEPQTEIIVTPRGISLLESGLPPAARRKQTADIVPFPTDTGRRVVLQGFVATTDLVEAYGISLAPESMYLIAADLRTGKIPMQVEHDDTAQFSPNLTRVDVRETEGGSLACGSK